MRRVFLVLLLLTTSSTVSWITLRAQAPAANAIVAATRQALGGEPKLSALHSLTATGHTRLLRGNNLVPIEFEMNIEWPDRYVRRDEVPAQDTGLTVTGFAGDALIRGPAAPSGGPPGRGLAVPAPQAQVAVLKADINRLLLGAIDGTLPSFTVSFSYVAMAEAPEGRADVVEATGPDGFVARVFTLQETHVPVMVSWRSAPNVENRLYFADYRDVGGIKWPFRLRRAVGTNTIEETTFDRVRINQRIDPKKFEVPK